MEVNFEVILACDITGGIGKNGIIPWKCREDLINFKNITMNGILIMGRKTVENLPFLIGRKIFMLTRRINSNEIPIVINSNNITVINSFEEFINIYISSPDLIGKRIFIAGGSEIYASVFRNNFKYAIKKYHITFIPENFYCDVSINLSKLIDIVEKCREKRVTYFNMENITKYIEYIM